MADAGAVYLGGGGSADDEGLLWQAMVRDGDRVLYWPIALPVESHPSALAWLTGALGSSVRVVMWSVLSEHTAEELAGFDLLMVGGGNTYALLDSVRRAGLTNAVGSFLAGGGRYYGGSAGAVLAGADIDIAAPMDPNDVGLTATTGLRLVGPYAVLPHADRASVAAAASWAVERHIPVLCLPENGGAVVQEGGVRLVGPGESWLIETNGRVTALSPGAELDLG